MDHLEGKFSFFGTNKYKRSIVFQWCICGNDVASQSQTCLFPCPEYAKVEAPIPVLDPLFTLYKNRHAHNHEHPNISSMDHAPGIVGTHVDKCYWWRGNHRY
jgi:hypothetical protein